MRFLVSVCWTLFSWWWISPGQTGAGPENTASLQKHRYIVVTAVLCFFPLPCRAAEDFRFLACQFGQKSTRFYFSYRFMSWHSVPKNWETSWQVVRKYGLEGETDGFYRVYLSAALWIRIRFVRIRTRIQPKISMRIRSRHLYIYKSFCEFIDIFSSFIVRERLLAFIFEKIREIIKFL
jgi:hypothetical protein